MKLTICTKYKVPQKNTTAKLTAAYYLKLMSKGNSVLCSRKEATRFYPAASGLKMKVRVKHLPDGKARVWRIA